LWNKLKIMNLKYLLFSFCLFALPLSSWAGNPDRQGEAGAYQLLMNPWARSAGLHGMNISSVAGVESIQNNVAGLSRFMGSSEISVSHMRYLVGSEINMSAIGFAQKMSKGGAFGISLTSVDFGDLVTTTVETPEGTGAFFSPSFFTLSLSYAKTFDNKVSVGTAVKFVNESISNTSARGIAIDAGVQYFAGTNDRFKLGIALRNVGTKMRHSGEGLSQNLPAPTSGSSFNHTFYQRSNEYDLPSQLIIGISNDWKVSEGTKITGIGTFVSNAYSRDNVGAGAEATIGPNFIVRAAYKYEFGVTNSDIESSVDNSIAAGISFGVPSKKKESNRRFWFDYAYRSTLNWQGSHNLAIRLNL
jgi:hypothetical protein